MSSDTLRVSVRVTEEMLRGGHLVEAFVALVRDAVRIEIRDQVREALRPELDRLTSRLEEATSEMVLVLGSALARDTTPAEDPDGS